MNDTDGIGLKQSGKADEMILQETMMNGKSVKYYEEMKLTRR